MNGRVWSRSELGRLRYLFADTETSKIAVLLRRSIHSVNNTAWKLGLRKSAAHVAEMLRKCGVHATGAGKATRFQRGIVPFNKGLRRPGWYRGRMRETQFKKGQPSRNAMPMWSFRFVDGYLMLKTGAPTPKPITGWEYVHKLVWEQANGPLPSWHVARIWWKDGDHSNCVLSNLELVPSRAHMLRTTIHNLPRPLVHVIQLAGALKRKIRTREKRNAA